MTINAQADELVQKIKHMIITSSGHTAEDATLEEFYQAFCNALHEEIMINMTATIDTTQYKKPRIINFLSMEYLPGRLLGNNICNMGAKELVKAVLQKMDRNIDDLIACESDPGLGNGGLGRLSSCFLDSLAALKYPARAYGLRYQYGIFEQEIWNGMQVERPDCWLLNTDPWESRRDLFSVSIRYGGVPIEATNKHGDEVCLLEDYEEVRALPFDVPIIGYSESIDYSVLLLRLWSTKESPRNFLLQRYNAGFLGQASENTALTDVLYPNDNNELGKRVRLKQEFLLVSASLQDIIRRHLHVYGDLSQFADKVRIQINDTHPAMLIAELVRMLTKNYDFSWQEAWEVCQTVCSYTNHTILKEALEEWNEHRVQELLPRQFRVIQKLNWEFCNTIRARYPGDEDKVRRLSIIENGQVRMANLAVYGCHKVNGVAKLHSEILKTTVFKDFYDLYPDKFTNVTNGVTHRRWLFFANPLLSDFITKRIGRGWICDFKQIAKLKDFASDPQSQDEFLSIKRKNKEAFHKFLTRENSVRDAKGKIIAHSHVLEATSLVDVQIKRFHEYKRQLLNALHLIMLYQEVAANPSSRSIHRLSVFAGKAAPGYAEAKQTIQLICAIARKFHADPAVKKHLCVAFVENYNVSRAEVIIPAADLSEQISAAGWEASGTGNMKLTMNGALTIGTEDGANIEMRQAVTDRWWPFRFGNSAEQNQEPYKPWDIYVQDTA
ncbi:MAG TPA: glycogen/starch/alpha-glucan family phosphorylase, partial [Chlamydiales bacterium]|nr:glycogen/starch/alpha-glucan family phosphorylase [Chlamydiales bacterium]